MNLVLLILLYVIAAINGQEERHYNSWYNYHRQPHILFFMGDDIGWNDVGWNNKRIHTPFMDTLAKSGVILDHYYTFTVCTPSRASMLTGYYADRLGLQRGVLMPTQPYGVPLRFKILPELLQEVGYESYVVGKWHIGYCSTAYTPLMRGVTGFMGFYNGGEENYEHCLGYLGNRTANGDCYGFDYRINDDLAHQYDGQYSGTVFANYAVDVLDQYDGENPIFMYIALTDPHFPLQPPQEYIDNCQDSVNEARKVFCGAMNAMDAAMEAIVTKLREKGMYDNSVIIFASDNGASNNFGGNNYPLRGEKGTIYEGGARVPAFFHSPLLKKSYTNKELIHVSDWYPTISYLAGASPASDLDGLNQWRTISRNERSPRTELPYLLDSTEDGKQMAAIRDRRYKLIAGSGGNNSDIYSEEDTVDNSFDAEYMAKYTDPYNLPFDLSDTDPKLFDLINDPTESNNLASKMPRKVQELRRRLFRMRQRSRPAMNLRRDPSGNPENFDNAYTPGWCTPYYDTPTYAIEETNQYIYPPM